MDFLWFDLLFLLALLPVRSLAQADEPLTLCRLVAPEVVARALEYRLQVNGSLRVVSVAPDRNKQEDT